MPQKTTDTRRQLGWILLGALALRLLAFVVTKETPLAGDELDYFWRGAERLQGIVPEDHPLSFARTDRELCFDRIRPELAMPEANLHFPRADTNDYIRSWDGVHCAVMQGGQGDVKHWAFNDPVRRDGPYRDDPPSSGEYMKLDTRVVDLHPMTIMQNARTSGGGKLDLIPRQAVTVGPVQTLKAEKVSIWQAGPHDNALGMRLTTLMIGNRIADSACPMSLLSLHPNVRFNV